MSKKDIRDIKDEIAGFGTRLENVEGFFNNFETTLNNHMTDYKADLKETNKQIAGLAGRLSWGFWVLFGLFTVAVGGLIGVAVVLVQYYLKGG